ncbi:MAG: AMP-binding protein [Oscillospiraceae bacterium]
MLNVHKKFSEEKYDSNGLLVDYHLHCEDNYNFAYDVMDEIAKFEPDKRALLWTNDEGEEISFTYGDIKRYSDKTANMLKSYGIGKGDMVMLVLKRHYQFWFAVMALCKLGAVAIPATHLLTKKDFVYRFNAATVKALICTADNDVGEHAMEAMKECSSLKVAFMANGNREKREANFVKEGFLPFDKLIEEASEDFEPVSTKIEEPMLMYFTSGTTGYPKMVMHNHTYSLGHLLTAKHWQHVDSEGIHFTMADTGWGKAAWGKLYGQWLMESCIFVYDFQKFTPSDLLPLFAKYRITSFCAPPTMFRFFIKEDLSKYDLSSLKYATIAGEALNAEVYNVFYRNTGIKLMEGFGQTETTCLVANIFTMTPKPGSMGKPVPQYDVDIVDEDGISCEDGITGEIVIRTDKNIPFGLFMGYYRADEITAKVWNNGLYHTGDTAWRDEDGYFWYVGRTDDVIKSSGYRIGPFEIESVLMEHPSVLECAITAAPDPVRGQVVKATIVLASGYTPSEELKKELQNYVKKQTAPYKYPRIVEFVDELPKTISGKIRRAAIRDGDSK